MVEHFPFKEGVIGSNPIRLTKKKKGKMKNLKILLILVFMSFFASSSYSLAKERDCSNPKKFHEKIMCKKIMSLGNSETSTTSSEASTSSGMTGEVKEKSKGVFNWLKKSLKGKRVEE